MYWLLPPLLHACEQVYYLSRPLRPEQMADLLACVQQPVLHVVYHCPGCEGHAPPPCATTPPPPPCTRVCCVLRAPRRPDVDNSLFLPWAAWAAVWCALMLLASAALGACRLVHKFTRLAGETFGMLIAVLFLQQGVLVGVVPAVGRAGGCARVAVLFHVLC